MLAILLLKLYFILFPIIFMLTLSLFVLINKEDYIVLWFKEF
jgi:hypothetical protein